MAATLTAIALVVFTGPNAPMAGAIAHLESSDGTQLLVDITNRDGYAEWNNVPVPFVGMLKIAGTVQYYEQAVTIKGQSVTLRVGPSAAAPQDILLPAADPFV